MWLYKIMCVFILAKSTVNASACNPWGSWNSWSSCDRSCGVGERTRQCSHGGWTQIQSESCNTFCYHGTPYSGGCHCRDWRTGYCCEDIVNCMPETARCGQQCINTNGSFTCACDSGYSLNPDGFTCDDTNECKVGNGGCAHICVNIPGSYTCSCNNGYAPHDGAHQCTDIDECAAGVSTCSQICINSKGTYHCECKDGFYLANNTVTCINYGSSISNDGMTEGRRHTNSEKSSAIGVGIGVTVGVLFLVGGAVVIVVLKRRGILNCNLKTGNNKPSDNETAINENMTNGTNTDTNVPDHNYFILEQFEQSFGNNSDHFTASTEANMEDDYNTIHETEEPYEHVNVENCDYDQTTNALTPGSGARQTDNLYNKLKVDRPGYNGQGQRQGLSVVRISEDDYDTTSAEVTHGKDDVSDYNHIPRTAYTQGLTGDDVNGDKGGEYDAINDINFKDVQPNNYD